MRKILTLLGVVLLSLLGLTARAQMIYGEGQFKTSGQYWNGSWTPKTVDATVSASFNGNFNSIGLTGMTAVIPEYTNGMNLRVDAQGNVTSGSTTTAYSGGDYSSYTATPSGVVSLSGKAVNTGESQSTITLNPWGDVVNSNGTWFFNYGKWEETTIVLDFQIPIIPQYVAPEPEPEPGDELFGTYKWNVNYAEGISVGSNTMDLIVEIYNVDGTNYYVKEVNTNYFQGLTIPFTVKNSEATFTPTKLGDSSYWGSACYNSSGLYMPNTPSKSYPISVDNGIEFTSQNGLGLYTSSSATQFSPQNAAFAFYVISYEAFGGEEPEPEQPEQPGSMKELDGPHTLTATVEYLNGGAQASTVLPETFQFNITNGKLADFFPGVDVEGTGIFPKDFQYDPSSGMAYIQTNEFGSYYTGGFSGTTFSLGYVPAGEEWPGVITKDTKDEDNDPVYAYIRWRVTEDGHLIIPSFDVVNYTNANNPQVIARYTNVVVDGYTPPTSDLTGEYTWYLQASDIIGNTQDTVEVKVQVSKVEGEADDEENGIQYYQFEEIGTDYFMGQKVKFQYSEATFCAYFGEEYGSTVYVGELGGKYVWMAPFNKMDEKFTLEIMPSILVPYDSATRTFDFTKDGDTGASVHYGIGFFTANNGSTETWTPENVYDNKAYFILNSPAEGNVTEGSYPPLSTVAGEYIMNATVTFEGDFGTISQVTANFPSKVTFTLGDTGSLKGFIGSAGRDNNMKYDIETGELYFERANLGSISYYPPGAYAPVTYGFGYMGVDGEWVGGYGDNGGQMKANTTGRWQVSEDGVLSIPDFYIVDYNSSPYPIICKYSDIELIKVVPAPEATTFVGSEFGTFAHANGDVTTTYAYTLDYTIDYDPEAQSITVTPSYKWFNDQTPVGYTGDINVYVPATNTFFTDNKDGTYTSPADKQYELDATVVFDMWVAVANGQFHPTPVSYMVGSEQAEAPVDPVLGVYDIELQPVNISNGATLNSEGINVAVVNAPKSDIATLSTIDPQGNSYQIVELGSANYFDGNAIPFTFNSNQAFLSQQYIGENEDGEYVWFAPILYSGTQFEIQNDYPVSFVPGEGFTFNEGAGFGFFTSDSASGLSPIETISTFYALNEPAEGEGDFGGDEEGSYPTLEELIGTTFPFSATVVTESAGTTGDFDGYTFPDTFEFTIGEPTGINYQFSISGFIVNGNLQGIYDEATGVMTITANYGNVTNGFLAPQIRFADINGQFAMGNGSTFKWQVTPEGGIEIPDFTVLDKNNTKLATYSDVSTEAEEVVYPIPTKEQLDGTYTFKAGEYELVNSNFAAYFPEEFTFTLTNSTNYLGEPVIKVADFLFKASSIGSGLTANEATYDESTGVLTFTGFTISSFVNNAVDGVKYVGIAPDGEWNGISAMTAYKLTMEFNTNGTFEISGFDLIQYTGSTINQVLAHYKDVVITKEGGFEPGGDEPIDQTSPWDFLEGVWTMYEFSLATNEKVLNDNNENPTYDADAIGTTITFYDNGGQFNIVAEGIDDTTLKFSYAQVTNNGSQFEMYQIPFINNEFNHSNYNDIANIDTTVSFEATYDPVAQTITFPEGVGFRYAPFTAQGSIGAGGIEDAIIFQAPATFAEFVPALEWNTDVPGVVTPGIDGISVKKAIQGYHFDLEEAASFNAVVTIIASTEDGAVNPTETFEATLEEEDGVYFINFTVDGLAKGHYDLRYVINALDAEGGILATSPEASASSSVGFEIFLSSGYTTTVTDNALIINYEVSPPISFDITEVPSWQGQLYATRDRQENERPLYIGDATMEWGTRVGFNAKGTITIDRIPAGSYELFFGVYGFDEEGQMIVSTAGRQRVEFTITEDIGEFIPALTFEDFTIEITSDGTSTGAMVPVSLESESSSIPAYAGFQFDVVLPENLKVNGVTVTNEELIEAGVYATSEPVPNTDNTYRVLGFYMAEEGVDFAGFTATEDLVTLAIDVIDASIYTDTTEETMTIQKVIFSDILGQDMNWDGSEGTVTIEVLADNPYVDLEITSIDLMDPSYTSQQGDVTTVTAGQQLEFTLATELKDPTADATGSVRATITDAEGEIILDNEGVSIVEIEEGVWVLTVDEEFITEGETTITVTFFANDGDEVIKVEQVITVKAILLGDSNSSGEVTVSDVVTTANYIAEKPIAEFNYPNANVIDDDEINPQDITATVNIVLGKFDGNRTPQNVKRHANTMTVNDALVASNFKAGNTTIAVSLDNSYNYAALAATIIVPDGMKVYELTAGERAAAHELVWNRLEDGNIKVVLYSLSNDSFINGEGSLFNLTVSADEFCGNLQIEGINASDASSNGFILGFEGGQNVSGTTGIDGIYFGADDNARYFTIDGIEVRNPQPGQILIRVEGDNVEKVLVK